MPMDAPPAFFPHYARVTILGFQHADGTIHPSFIVPDNPGAPILAAPGGFPSDCSQGVNP